MSDEQAEVEKIFKDLPAMTTGITDLMISLGSRTPIVMMPTPDLAVP
jgi:hypothetical protein